MTHAAPSLLGDRDCQPPRLDSVQSMPEHLGSVLGGVQGGIGGFGVGRDSFFELRAPDVRVIDIRFGVQREVAASLVVGSIHGAQAALFLSRDARVPLTIPKMELPKSSPNSESKSNIC